MLQAEPYSPYGYPPIEPPSRPRRERSLLGRLTVSAMLLAVGVLGLLDLSGAVHPTARHYLAVALGVLGAGLLAGAWFGRARWLIAVGLPLTVVLVGVGTAQDVFGDGAGVRHVQPVSTADLLSRYELGAGGLELDLSKVDFTAHRVSTSVHVGLGSVTVVLPRDVDVTVNATEGVGRMDILGRQYDGAGVERRLIDDGPDGPGGGQLGLVLDVGLGHVEVHRASA